MRGQFYSNMGPWTNLLVPAPASPGWTSWTSSELKAGESVRSVARAGLKLGARPRSSSICCFTPLLFALGFGTLMLLIVDVVLTAIGEVGKMWLLRLVLGRKCFESVASKFMFGHSRFERDNHVQTVQVTDRNSTNPTDERSI